MSVNYGSATRGVSDVPLISVQTTDPFLVIGERVARRLTTPHGGLGAVDANAANEGLDVRQWTNGRLAPTQIDQAQRQIQAECLRDEEVQSAFVQISFVSGGALTVSIQMVAAAGPFTLTMSVLQVSYQVLVSA